MAALLKSPRTFTSVAAKSVWERRMREVRRMCQRAKMRGESEGDVFVASASAADSAEAWKEPEVKSVMGSPVEGEESGDWRG